jgi:predicted nuclease of predicted toxin-antitoxin system
VKLLLDENLSERIVPQIADLFADSTHIRTAGLKEADDGVIWNWAKQHGFTIVSKDTDFYHRAVVYDHPPKFIWLRVGNCPTNLITALLRSRYDTIRRFIESGAESLLVLER